MTFKSKKQRIGFFANAKYKLHKINEDRHKKVVKDLVTQIKAKNKLLKSEKIRFKKQCDIIIKKNKLKPLDSNKSQS